MRSKSCLVQLILLIVIVGVSSLAIRQALYRAAHGAETATLLSQVTPTVVQPEAIPQAAAALITPAFEQRLDTYAEYEEEDLALASSRPVMLDEGYPVGMAATAAWLYLACQPQDGSADSGDAAAFVVRVSLDDYSVPARNELSRSADRVLGGMAAGPDAVWVALRDDAADGGGALLALDPITLEVARTVVVSVPPMAVAVAPDGSLYASRCQPGELLHLSGEGAPLAQTASLADACYTDLEFIQGYLVGVATVHGVGVMDVLAPDDLTLVARHALALTSARDNPVAGNAFASDGTLFMFAPDRTPNPIIMVYRPRDGDLSRLIPVALPW